VAFLGWRAGLNEALKLKKAKAPTGEEAPCRRYLMQRKDLPPVRKEIVFKHPLHRAFGAKIVLATINCAEGI
jgi:hypothetical protein